MSTPRKLLFIDQYAEVGGGQKVFLELIAIALRQGFAVTVRAPRGGRLEKEIQEQFDDRVQWRPLLPAPWAWFCPISTRGFDSIHVNGLRMAPVTLAGTVLLQPKRVLFHLHLNYSKRAQFFLALHSNTTALYWGFSGLF